MDGVEFRTGQRDQWNVAAGGWKKWSELIDGSVSAISERPAWRPGAAFWMSPPVTASHR